jgi:hypothetical protein
MWWYDTFAGVGFPVPRQKSILVDRLDPVATSGFGVSGSILQRYELLF